MFDKKKKTGKQSGEKGSATTKISETTAIKQTDSFPSIPAIVICALLIAAGMFITLMVIKFNVLPRYLLIASILILAGLIFICVALAWNTKKPMRFAIGVFLSVVILACFVIGGFALKKAWDTAQKVTAGSVSLAEVGVYVNADDKAAEIKDLSGYTFGVLKAQDREDAGKALLKIASELDNTIYVAEYDSVIKLI